MFDQILLNLHISLHIRRSSLHSYTPNIVYLLHHSFLDEITHTDTQTHQPTVLKRTEAERKTLSNTKTHTYSIFKAAPDHSKGIVYV